MTCLQLFKFSSRPFNPNNVAQEFTTNVKIRVFSGKKDLFDDLFQSKSSLKEVLQEAQSRLSPDDLRKFTLYRERRLASIPLEGLRVATMEPTPSISLSENSSASRSKSSAAREISEHPEESVHNKEKNEETIKDTTQSSTMAQQQVIASPPREVPPPVVETPLVTTELDKEWETFNELINLEGQVPKTPVSNTQVVQEVVSTIVSSAAETEHLPIAPSS